MTSEIFAFVQAQPQTQTTPQTISSAPTENQQQGLFDNLISELTAQSEEAIIDPQITQTLITPETDIPVQPITISGGNSFAQSVIDILADMVPDEEIPPELSEGLSELKEAVSELKDSIKELKAAIKGESHKDIPIREKAAEALPEFLDGEGAVSEKIASLPEETKQELKSAVDEIITVLQDSDNDEKSEGIKLAEIITSHLAKPLMNALKPKETDEANEITDDDTDDEITYEVPDEAVNSSGLSGVQIVAPEITNAPETSQEQPENPEHITKQTITPPTSHHTQQTQRTPREVQTTITSPQDTQEAPKTPEQRFSEILQTRRAERENQTSGQNNNPQNSGHEDNSNDFSQSQDNFFGQRNTNSSRNRTDSRRTANETSRTQTERTSTPAPTHRTDSRADFQSFFEGILSNRRTASQASPLPMSLRSTANFTQATALRDGLTNVVRFIRADGVQKANVIVDPPALGRISVELTSGTSGVAASIKVASEQIRQLVQDQLSQLRMNLSQQGVQVAEFTVDVQQDNSQDRSDSQDDEGRRRPFAVDGIEDDDAEEFRVDLEEGLLYWVA